MKLSQFVAALKSDLTAVAAVGDDATAEAAQKLAVALEGSVGLRLVDAFASAALELTAQLPSGRVEGGVRAERPRRSAHARTNDPDPRGVGPWGNQRFPHDSSASGQVTTCYLWPRR